MGLKTEAMPMGARSGFVCVKSHFEVQFIGPGTDDSVLRSRPVGVLVLEDIVSSWSVSILIENHRCTGTSWNKDSR